MQNLILIKKKLLLTYSMSKNKKNFKYFQLAN